MAGIYNPKMKNEVTPEVQRRLVKSALKWIRILDESAAALSSNPKHLLSLPNKYDFKNLTEDQFREVRTAVFSIPTSAHLIAICLRHIDEHARELKRTPLWTGEVAVKGEKLQDLVASEEIRNLRDVIEHSAEYLAGKGRKPALVQDPESDWPSVSVINEKVTTISVFGHSYTIKQTIESAIEFARALNAKTST